MSGVSVMGRVSLVGAGPGDPELLTLKALRVIACADVVLFDELVSAEILALTRATARRLHVGKRGYRGGTRQDAIHALMIRFARRGLHVVRLKAGDPMLFGRAGEEIDVLEAAGIAVDVVPGITAGIALAAATRCSLTQRERAAAVSFVTGHAHDHAIPSDLAAAAPTTTLIVYMGAQQAAAIRDRLLECGRAPDTPVVLVAATSRPGERQWHGRLDQLADGAAALAGDGPIVIGIGTVFAAAARRHDSSAAPASAAALALAQ